MRLLIIEDEPALGELLHRALERAGFAGDVTSGIAEAEEHLRLAAYDALILDLGLADGDGLTLLRALRRRSSQLPVLILTARDAPEDRVAGLDSGADDYVVKPFHMDELISRIRALLRRPNTVLGVDLRLGNVVLHTTSREVAIGGEPVALSLRETSLLELLLRRQGNVVPREAIEEGPVRVRQSDQPERHRCSGAPAAASAAGSRRQGCGAYHPRRRLLVGRSVTGPARPTEWRLAHRLAWRLATVMLVSVMLAAAAVAWRTVATIRSLDDTALQSQARLVAGQLSAGPAGRPVLYLPGALATVFDASDGQNLFVVYDGQDVATAASDPRAVAIVRPFLPVRPQEGYFRVPPLGGLSGGAARHRQRLSVPGASWWPRPRSRTKSLVESLLRDFLVSALWLLLPIGGATVLIGVLTIRHGLRPLRETSAAAGRVGASPAPACGCPYQVCRLS